MQNQRTARRREARSRRGWPAWPLGLAAALLTALLSMAPTSAMADDACPAVGSWLEPATGQAVPWPELVDRLATKQVVLLGESHPNAEHHRWQLQVLAALQARRPDLVVGFEMLPRGAQPALDRWSQGDLGAEDFLREVNWDAVWGYDADLYLPLFHFARMHRLPAVGLNVDRGLIRQVSELGWAGVATADRQGVGDPAPASDAYKRSLADVFAEKRRQGVIRRQDADEASEPAQTETADREAVISEILAEPRFVRFVEAQQTWDRAMAEALASAHGRPGKPLAVGIMGTGHAEFGYGVPHQLADLGLAEVAVLLPVSIEEACQDLPMDLADAVFVIDPPASAVTAKPRLGVIIEAADGGLRVNQVLPDSVAAATGLKTGDLIVEAAGFAVRRPADLIAIITRQAPGTWLPLTVQRDGAASELVARFPQGFGAGE